MKKVGIYAGTFDPVHDGHIAFALKASERLDKVFLMVEPRPRRKQGVKSLEHRFEMARLVTKQHKKLGVIKLSQARFTPRETMPLLHERFKGAELHLLFGDDVIHHMVDNIADWPFVEDILQSAHILIASRKHETEDIRQKIDLLQEHGLSMQYSFLNIDMSDVSSSKIRQDVKHGKNARGVDKSVLNYIKDNRLYSSSGVS